MESKRSPGWKGKQLTIFVQCMTRILCISRIQKTVILWKAKLHFCHATSKTIFLVLVTCFIVYGCISWFLVLSGFYISGLSRNLFWILFLQKGKKITFAAHQKKYVWIAGAKRSSWVNLRCLDYWTVCCDFVKEDWAQCESQTVDLSLKTCYWRLSLKYKCNHGYSGYAIYFTWLSIYPFRKKWHCVSSL